jgi:hypothetical protein
MREQPESISRSAAVSIHVRQAMAGNSSFGGGRQLRYYVLVT